MPVDEVARRAGVGIGTVYRHFPTKEALFEAIMHSRVEFLTAQARDLADAEDAGGAFFGFVVRMAEDFVLNKALGEALVAAGRDLMEITAEAGQELREAQEVLLRRAQAVGAVRPDLTGADFKAILVGIITAERYVGGDPGRLSRIMIECLRARN